MNPLKKPFDQSVVTNSVAVARAVMFSRARALVVMPIARVVTL